MPEQLFEEAKKEAALHLIAKYQRSYVGRLSFLKKRFSGVEIPEHVLKELFTQSEQRKLKKYAQTLMESALHDLENRRSWKRGEKLEDALQEIGIKTLPINVARLSEEERVTHFQNLAIHNVLNALQTQNLIERKTKNARGVSVQLVTIKTKHANKLQKFAETHTT